MTIAVINTQKDLDINEDLIRSCVKHSLSLDNVRYDEVAIHFVDRNEICRLHAEHFDDPSPTDCITFPIDDADEPGYRMLGEVFVCPETAKLFVEENGGDPLRETILYVVHGLLHLQGYDDIAEDDRKRMREKEAEHLAYLEKQQVLLMHQDKTIRV